MALGTDLGKLTLRILDQAQVPGFPGGQLEVPFNPNEYSIERNTNYAEVAIPGLDSPVLQWVRGEGDNVNFELFMDITDRLQGGLVTDGNDVRQLFVRPLERLMVQSSTLHAPPRIQVRWGTEVVIARAVVRSLSVTYALFDTLGRPVRATARLGLRQDTPAAAQLAEAGLTSPDRTNVVTVREGDTLPAIAFREYRNAAQWRPIAEANDVADPLDLTPGQTLVVPRIF